MPTRLFSLFKGTHWTLIGYDVPAGDAPTARRDVHVHTIGERGDIVDTGGHVRDGYGLTPGQWVLVRPDGYVAAVTADLNVIDAYLETHLNISASASPRQEVIPAA
ncbi:hypothetical protein [Microbispora sp. GKU 823]|uniref:hypothetical protein n=1 Tax=Microbispora sp. GKU 823 TaxID=1652100 RepID=UPI001C4E01BF|nr:hypothetical protein [Microbispora sp. GKU 823]